MARSALAQHGAMAALVVAGLLPAQAPAGDEVDYSAPYLTVENGKLVTKYPAKQHTNAQAAAAPQAAAGAEPASEEKAPLPVAFGIAAAGLVVAAAAFFLRRRRRRG
jgi:LPXTG-motif cell wall-anchored protein